MLDLKLMQLKNTSSTLNNFTDQQYDEIDNGGLSQIVDFDDIDNMKFSSKHEDKELVHFFEEESDDIAL